MKKAILKEPNVRQMTNPFRNSNNNRLTKALFYELNEAEECQPIYTLKDQDHKGFPSLYRLYLELEDTTEYEFANKYLDGWEHWTFLCAKDWFQPYLERWRKELELKLEARYLEKLKEIAADSSRDAVQAAKYLLDRSKKTSSSSRGRPSKAQVREAAHELAKGRVDLNKDFELISSVTAPEGTYSRN